MLNSLDPHSNFLDPETYDQMKESQRGSFSGLGIMVGIRNDMLTVIAPIEGTPAHRKGIRSGDVIEKIEEEDTREMPLEEAVTKLRGPKGTSVTITIHRPGMAESFEVSVVRDDIRTKSVENYYMLRPGIGYVRAKDFTSQTTQELDEALAALLGQGMEKLLLDLRDNPGGLLEQAVTVSGRFLPEGELVVYTLGRRAHANMEFAATGAKEEPAAFPLIVLVNGASASASEIVAGAIQDHDRGLIVGETTWGKGLVQSVYPIEGGAALALTTARYYTPSGRLIQRDYSSFYDYFSRQNGEEEDEREIHHTDMGREVRGGGGITPDVIVEAEELLPFVERIWLRNQAFFTFATIFTAPQLNQAPPEPVVRQVLATRSPIDRDFTVDDDVLAAFERFLVDEGIEHEATELAEAREQIRTRLQYEIITSLFGLEEGYRVLLERDAQVKAALELFDEAERLAAHRIPPKEWLESAPVEAVRQ
jgi:carboxyl-terminal processing protease